MHSNSAPLGRHADAGARSSKPSLIRPVRDACLAFAAVFASIVLVVVMQRSLVGMLAERQLRNGSVDAAEIAGGSVDGPAAEDAHPGLASVLANEDEGFRQAALAALLGLPPALLCGGWVYRRRRREERLLSDAKCAAESLIAAQGKFLAV